METVLRASLAHYHVDRGRMIDRTGTGSSSYRLAARVVYLLGFFAAGSAASSSLTSSAPPRMQGLDRSSLDRAGGRSEDARTGPPSIAYDCAHLRSRASPEAARAFWHPTTELRHGVSFNTSVGP